MFLYCPRIEIKSLSRQYVFTKRYRTKLKVRIYDDDLTEIIDKKYEHVRSKKAIHISMYIK